MNPEFSALSSSGQANAARAPQFRTRLRGIIPPLITPLRGADALDHGGLERLVEHVLAGGVHGLFILGTSGEAPNLSHRLRRELVSAVCRQVNRRAPILVGVTDTSIVEAREMAAHAAAAGADAVVAAPPYYFALSQEEIVLFVDRLLEGLALPLFLYNMPRMTKVQFAPETLQRLAQKEQIAGIKDSSGDLEYFASLIPLKKERPDWSVFVGPESLLADTMKLGGDGGVNGGANFMPELLVSLFNALDARNEPLATTLQASLLQVGQIYSVGTDAASSVKAMKCACSLLGLCGDLMSEPFEPFGAVDRAQIQSILKSVSGIRTTP